MGRKDLRGNESNAEAKTPSEVYHNMNNPRAEKNIFLVKNSTLLNIQSSSQARFGYILRIYWLPRNFNQAPDLAIPSKAGPVLATISQLGQLGPTSGRILVANRNWGTEPGKQSGDPENLERETGFEPATSTLARLHSTTELLPHRKKLFILCTRVLSMGRCEEISNFIGRPRQ